MKNFMAPLIAGFSFLSLVACGDAQEASQLHSLAPTAPLASGHVIIPIIAKPDLLAEIVDGASCPVNSKGMVNYRIVNNGKAIAPASTLRLKIRLQGAVSYWYQTSDIGISSLAPGQSTTVGFANGQWNTLRFFNGSASPGVRVTSWSIMVDDSGSAQESNELNNMLNNAGQCFPG